MISLFILVKFLLFIFIFPEASSSNIQFVSAVEMLSLVGVLVAFETFIDNLITKK
jgi:hypothetical protein